MDCRSNSFPKNFRSLTIFPTETDLFNENIDLTACKIKDPYDSIENYLDVQFKLLREDFMSPLRRGLTQYLKSGQKLKNYDITVYKNVILKESLKIENKNSVGLRVFAGKPKRLDQEEKERLIPGGLVLLSSDNFKNEIIIATIIDSNETKTKKNYHLITLSIEPVKILRITRGLLAAKYVMLEPKVYFEPYSAVLRALQQHKSSLNFPMKKYLVDASDISNLPKYLSNQSLFTTTELPWQTDLKKKLNKSQYDALKHALSEEFAVIQGPPGTGKTFVALVIVRFLLENKQLWLHHGPIVITCFTNHALDQFMEGISKITDSIVRIGERSQSKLLEKFLLKNKRQKWMKNKSSLDKDDFYEAKDNLSCVKEKLAHVLKIISYLKTSEAIVPYSCLIGSDIPKSLQSNKNIVEWLTERKNLNSFVGCEKNINEDHESPTEEQEMIKIPEGFDLIFPLDDINLKINIINNRIDHLKKFEKENLKCSDYFKELKIYKSQLKSLHAKKNILKREFMKHPILNPDVQPTQNKRWKTYGDWIIQSYDAALEKYNSLKCEFDKKNSLVKKMREIIDIEILKSHQIIGLTTSCAARLHLTLDTLKVPIVIVEEAAKILESHIVGSLAENCQHIILIGDHKQLRPLPSDYKIGKDFNLEISLFERMVNIRGNCSQLVCQHRMRPEIAKLLTPSIYANLENGKNVNNFPNVKGLEKNLFFINHRHQDKKINETRFNQHEAKTLISLAIHLIKQGYETQNLTILCAYSGQLPEIEKEKNKYSNLEDLYVATVDDYQGEENKIILLSLVRNNGKGKIGFLKQENRVCVALSRAREGLFIMGNMDDLIVGNEIWPKIKKVLEELEAIGEDLILRCQNHPETVIKVKQDSDFKLCPEGGCLKICGANLRCGHTCRYHCHILDKKHTSKYGCKVPCPKLCPHNHSCPLKCFEGCKPCLVEVECTLKCGHTVQKPCYIQPDKFECKVEKVYSCGHKFFFKCNEIIGSICGTCKGKKFKPSKSKKEKVKQSKQQKPLKLRQSNKNKKK